MGQKALRAVGVKYRDAASGCISYLLPTVKEIALHFGRYAEEKFDGKMATTLTSVR